MKIPVVSLPVWKELYESALGFKKLEPWEFMDDSELFGIRDPITGEMGYACVMGTLGEVLALCVYRGAGGFDVHQRMLKREIDLDSGDFFAFQNCLMAEFSDREYLEKADREVIQSLGLKFRGPNSWPFFRSYVPGYCPWHLTEGESLFLTFALRCACDAVKKVDSGAIDLNSRHDKLFCYYPKGDVVSAAADFETGWEPSPIYRPDPLPPLTLGSEKLSQIRMESLKRVGEWEADVYFLPVNLADRDRPYFPISFMVVHQDSGFVLNAGCGKPEDLRHQLLSDAIIKAIADSGTLPDVIYVRDDKMASCLAPLGKSLGFKVDAKKRLNTVITARRAMEGFFRKGSVKEPPPKKLDPLKLDPRVMEKVMFDLSRKLRDHEFKSIDEANRYLGKLQEEGDMESAPAPENAWEVAQNLMYEAFEEENPTRRVELAKNALKISPDCADAYCLLAEETARNRDEARDLYQKAVEAGERSLGKEYFEKNAGHFWGMIESRPYMRARSELARCFWRQGDHQTALNHYYDLLRLNPNDNQGMRYVLLTCLGEIGRFDEMRKFMERKDYEDDCAVEWLYSKTLLAFEKEGASSFAAACLKEALKYNRYVPDYLLGKKQIPRRLPDRITMGGEDEGYTCADAFLPAWKKVSGAIQWLREEIKKLEAPKVGRNEPCSCGSGKKFKKCCGQ